MAKRKKRADPIAEPTPEQFGKGAFSRNTMAYRRIPVIDTMVSTGKLSARQFNGLSRYRDIAAAHERSPMRDSLDKALHGREGNGNAGAMVHMALHSELKYFRSALGALAPIAHAIAFEDETLAQWAIRKWGGREKRDGNVIYIAPRARNYYADTLREIRQAGDLLAKAIKA
jgi:hypothetical protein